MIYHANSDWLKGGFLGVEVFFVISGYLITLLLISEHERDHSVDMKQFWIRRARRLLPALFVMLFMLTIWTALFERSTLGKLRGDIVAALAYGSNWYQVYTGPGIQRGQRLRPAAPSVEPGGRGAVLPDLADRDGAAAPRGQPGDRRPQPLAVRRRASAITMLVALLYHQGPIGTPEVTPGGVLAHLRPQHRQGRLPLPVDVHPCRRPAARRRRSPWSGGRSRIMRGPMRNRGPAARRRRCSPASRCSG